MKIPRLVLISMMVLAGGVCHVIAEQVPDDRDRLVLEAALKHLCADTNFNLTRTTNPVPSIVLHAHTPEKTGFLSVSQVRSELRAQKLPEELIQALQTRNTKPDAKPDTYEAVAATYTNLTFSPGIVVADLTRVWKNSRSYREFEAAYPDACGFVRAYLPGYSADGTLAVLRASVGPTPHGATIIVLLEKTGNAWTVKWYKLARYA